MTASCCGGSGETLIFTCAGAAYCGQLANRVGLQLMQQGVGGLFCIAAVAAGIGDKTERARQARERMTLDGCADQCARKILEKAGLAVDRHVVLTALGIEKSPAQPNMITDARKVVDFVRQRSRATPPAPRGCCGGAAPGETR